MGARVIGRPVTGRRSAAGFTLIELMIVMVLITILASIGLALYGNSITRAKEAALSQDLVEMRKAIDEYYADKNKWPADLQTLVSDKYLRFIPKDPFTNSADTWQTVFGEPDPSNPTAAGGISDVKSGSDATAQDGTRYADW
jgi:general secretion pathway protein G